MAELIIPAQLREAHRAGIIHYLANSVGPLLGRLLELPAIRGDGTEFQIELYVTPIAIESRRLFTGFARDATERKAAETALKENAERLRLALDASGAGVWFWERAEDLRSGRRLDRALERFSSSVDSKTRWGARRAFVCPDGPHVRPAPTALAIGVRLPLSQLEAGPGLQCAS